MPKEQYILAKAATEKSGAGTVPVPIVIVAVVVVLIGVVFGIWKMSTPRPADSLSSASISPQQQSDGQWIANKIKSSKGRWNNLSPDEQQRVNEITQGRGQTVFGN